MDVISTNSYVCVHKLCLLCVCLQEFNSRGLEYITTWEEDKKEKNTVTNAATSNNLKGKPMTKTIGLHWLHQVTKHLPATDEASVNRAQLRVKPLYWPAQCPVPAKRVCWALGTEQVKQALDKTASKNATYKINPYCVTGAFLTLILRNCWALVIRTWIPSQSNTAPGECPVMCNTPFSFDWYMTCLCSDPVFLSKSKVARA